MRKNDSFLLYSSSDKSSDVLYFSGFFVPDKILCWTDKTGKKCGAINCLEFARAKKESSFDKIFSFEMLASCTRQFFKRQNISVADMIEYIFYKYKLSRFIVPDDFDFALGIDLMQRNIPIKNANDNLFKNRQIKLQKEAMQIKKANNICKEALSKVRLILEKSKIKDGKLFYKNKFITSERLRLELDLVCLNKGAIASQTIVASGKQACDPHCVGSGIIRANELIVIDIFPRILSSGYHGDISRTFLKGTPSDAQVRLVKTVAKAQNIAFSKIKAGQKKAFVHESVAKFFEESSYDTYRNKDGSWEGFFHSTGHGLGLDIHESPRLGKEEGVLLENTVVTVEPGLYYKDIGACRIEDVVWVKKDGFEKLSNISKNWIIK